MPPTVVISVATGEHQNQPGSASASSTGRDISVAFLVNVEAKLELESMYEAPAISFSYPGSEDLGQLWNELQAIGWTIPEQPVVPYQASSWVGTRGRSTEHEYRVEGFEVTADQWPLVEIADRGIQTINLLRRRGVDVKMPISYLDFLRKTQLQQKAANPPAPQAAHAGTDMRPASQQTEAQGPSESTLASRPRLSVVPDLAEQNDAVEAAVEAPTPTTTVRPVEVPQVILLSTKAWSVLQTEPGLELYQSVVVPGRTRWTWSQSTNSVENLGAQLPDPRILFETVELGWQRKTLEAPALEFNPETERTLWFIAHQFSEATELVSFLHEQPDTTAAVVHMNPLPRTTAFDDCFLVGAVVPAGSFAKIGSKVVSNFGDVIARGRVSPLADTATTFSR